MVFVNGMLRLFVVGTIASAANAAPFSRRSSNSNIRPIARSSLVESANATYDGCMYQVEGVGAFNSELSFDFTTMDALPDELIASTYTVGSGAYAPYSHIFEAENIILSDGEPLQMMVPGGQTENPLSTAQMVTAFDDVLYASVRTVAQASPVNGTVHGFFMYMNDTQETDIEIRTGDPTHVHFTNQETHSGNGETTYEVDAPSDMSSAYHEYRYDWLPDGTHFYIDGELVLSITKNVPSEPGWLMWNNWSNGWEWTMGPPAEDNIVLIKSISAYFNRTSITASCTASSTSTTASSTSTTAVATDSTITSANPTTSSSGNVGISSTGQSSTSSTLPSTITSSSLSTTSSSTDAITTNSVSSTSADVSQSSAASTFDTDTVSSDIPTTSTLSSTASNDNTSSMTSSASSTSNSIDTSSSTSSISSSTTNAIDTSSTTSSTTSSSTASPTVSCPTSNNTLFTDPTTSLPFLIECGIDHSGGDLAMIYVSSFADCIATCASNTSCVDVSLSGAACYMKSSVGAAVNNAEVSGARLVDNDSGNGTVVAGQETVGNATVSVHELIQLHVDAHLVQILSAD